MTGYTAIDLSRLPVPDVVETISTEAQIAAIKEVVLSMVPELAEVLALESETSVKLIEALAYFGVLFRARVNDAADATMLARATGADLDNLGALFGAERLTVTAANPDAIPPVAAVMEADAAFRGRIQLALEGFSTAGPRGAYLYHALSASGDVLDASIVSPAPGDVLVTVLSRTGEGTASAELLALVDTALNDEDVRPLCDHVIVQGAAILPYVVTAELTMFDGPDTGPVLATALAAVETYVADCHRLGRAVRRSGLFAALHQAGVERVTLSAPAADIEPTTAQAAWCSDIAVTEAV